MIERDFYPFPDSSNNDWIEQIRKDLKGKDFDSTLTSEIWESIKISPCYTKEEGSAFSHPILFNLPSPYPGQNPRISSNIVSIFPEDEKTANKEILEVLENGAEGLVLHLTGTENLNQILRGVLTEYIQIYFNPIDDPAAMFSQIENWIGSISLRTDMLNGGILWSPSSSLFMGKEHWDQEISTGIKLLNYFKTFKNFFPITIDFARYANAGGTGIQELTFGLGEIVDIMDAFVSQGVSISQALQQFAFLASAGELHFPEIAKLKVLRILISELAINLGASNSADSFHLIVSTSLWTKSRIDKNSNLIRQTYETMAGIIGGANSIWVRPVSEKTASILEKRIARNLSFILKEESHLDKIMDPSAGAYFLEDLEKQIHEKVLTQLADLEENGGWIENFKSRSIHSQIKSTRTSIQESVLHGDKNLVGVNKYQGKTGTVENFSFEKIEEKDFELLPSRASYLLEIQKSANS
ncbi:methylmalonyl-CoA mutase family protein [Algoriphagus marinus]|uniref:methylmalonyl-CoA mutase family protein n=1 Tax=Algoriphagus marinus TaxID=1925762 RepID=UPI000AFB8BA0|nr:methylmalonyl-CoA mutase family protein [Algoriphagus marinus]